MKQKSRKLLSRLGAAFMLGLSMFNFGAAWNKMRGGEIPRKTRNIRKRSQEELDQDVKQIGEIAEEEAQIVLASQQIKQDETQQQLQSETTSITQRAVRYAAISAWVISAGLVFSSAIFNYPFALGKGMLSLLPGIPHMASLEVESAGNYFEVGKEVPIDVVLDSGGESIKAASIVLEYDHQRMDFERFEIDRSVFDVSKDFLSEPGNGKIFVTLERSLEDINVSKQKIATFIFSVKEEGLSKVSVNRRESLVLKETESSKFANILGKVGDVQLRLIATKDHELICFEIDKYENDQRDDIWEKVSQGNILPSEEQTWNKIASNWGFTCSYDREFGDVYVLISGPSDELNNIRLVIDEEGVSDMNFGVSKKWQEERSYFFGAKLETGGFEKIQSLEEVGLEIDLQGEKLKWPQRGKARLVLQ